MTISMKRLQQPLTFVMLLLWLEVLQHAGRVNAFNILTNFSLQTLILLGVIAFAVHRLLRTRENSWLLARSRRRSWRVSLNGMI
jgi:hypothetical protein